MSTMQKSRLLGRSLGRLVTADEIDSISGAGCCGGTVSYPTAPNEEFPGGDTVLIPTDTAC